MTESAEILFKLMRASLGCGCENLNLGSDSESDPEMELAMRNVWRKVIDLSFEQGVAAIAVDGLGFAHDNDNKERLDFSLDSEGLEDLKYEWFGSVFANENDYSEHKQVIKELASRFSSIGIKTMVMKGYAASVIYPMPSHRSVGDIDLYLFGKGEEADRLMKEHGVEVRQNEDKHSTFTYKNISVENHATFVNVVEHPSLRELEDCLEQEAHEARFDEAVEVYLPTPTADALFLSHHLAGHFVYGGASLKQVSDWAMLAMKYGKEIDWNRVMEVAERAGYGRLLECLNGIVIAYLGVPESTFPKWDRDMDLENRVLNEILCPEFDKRGESWVGKGIRYFKSGWKYRLVYKEPMVQTFFRRSWALLRERYLPASRSVWQGR